MQRPATYEALLGIGSFKEALPDPGAVRQYLRTASDMVDACAHTTSDAARFVLAYEGMFHVVMAVLTFHHVRPGDTSGHRVTAIQRVADDLQLDVAARSVLARLHDIRNRVTYRAPIPPITRADAEAMARILTAMLPAARALIGL